MSPRRRRLALVPCARWCSHCCSDETVDRGEQTLLVEGALDDVAVRADVHAPTAIGVARERREDQDRQRCSAWHVRGCAPSIQSRSSSASRHLSAPGRTPRSRDASGPRCHRWRRSRRSRPAREWFVAARERSTRHRPPAGGHLFVAGPSALSRDRHGDCRRAVTVRSGQAGPTPAGSNRRTRCWRRPARRVVARGR